MKLEDIERNYKFKALTDPNKCKVLYHFIKVYFSNRGFSCEFVRLQPLVDIKLTISKGDQKIVHCGSPTQMKHTLTGILSTIQLNQLEL